MRICHLTTVHDWNDVRIFVKMCSSAISDGFCVDLVAPVDVSSPAVDTGGVTVHSLRKYRSRLLRVSLGTVRAIRTVFAIRAAWYHVHDPELLPLVLALRLAQRRVVFDFHEEFAAQIRTKPYVGRGSRAVASALARWWELVLCWAATRLVVATPHIRQRLPYGKALATTVRNYPTLDEFSEPSSTPIADRPRIAYYVGAVSAIRGCFEMIQAARLLAESGRAIDMRIAGPLESPNLERRARQAAATSTVSFLGRRTRRQVIADLGSARLGIVVLQPIPNYVNSLPVKIFEYMAAGIPVVASDFPLWREIVNGANCGLTVDPRDPEKLAEAIDKLIRNTALAQSMGLAGRHAVETIYHWTNEWARLRALYAGKHSHTTILRRFENRPPADSIQKGQTASENKRIAKDYGFEAHRQARAKNNPSHHGTEPHDFPSQV